MLSSYLTQDMWRKQVQVQGIVQGLHCMGVWCPKNNDRYSDWTANLVDSCSSDLA